VVEKWGVLKFALFGSRGANIYKTENILETTNNR